MKIRHYACCAALFGLLVITSCSAQSTKTSNAQHHHHTQQSLSTPTTEASPQNTSFIKSVLTTGHDETSLAPDAG